MKTRTDYALRRMGVFFRAGWTHRRSEVTRLLKEWSDGRQDALDSLLPQIYAELRRLASSYLRRERPDHTLQADRARPRGLHQAGRSARRPLAEPRPLFRHRGPGDAADPR